MPPPIGLTFAAAGYFCSFFIGVPLVNRGIRRGHAAYGPRRLPPDFITGILPREATNASAGRLTLHSGNVDTLAFQMALVGIVYGLTYGLVRLLGTLMPADAAAILWGFFFFFGLAVAFILRKGMQVVRVAHLVDDGIQRRITGWSVDYLIVATVAAIQLEIVWQYRRADRRDGGGQRYHDNAPGGMARAAVGCVSAGADGGHLRDGNRNRVLRLVVAAHQRSGFSYTGGF